MSKITKKELQRAIQRQESRIDGLVGLLAKKGYYDKDPQPQLKQLDQSVFDGLDEKWKSAATNTDGKAYLHNMPKSMMYFNHSSYGWCSKDYDAHEMQLISDGFDPSGFAIGFIERDIAKELLEIDLSGELTGSDLARAMFERGDNYIMCVVGTIREVVIIDTFQDGYFYSKGVRYLNPKPINNQGEPLMQSEAGL